MDVLDAFIASEPFLLNAELRARRVVCEHCGEEYASGSLYAHARACGEKKFRTKPRNLECTYPGCTKRYSREQSLKEHVEKHRVVEGFISDNIETLTEEEVLLLRKPKSTRESVSRLTEERDFLAAELEEERREHMQTRYNCADAGDQLKDVQRVLEKERTAHTQTRLDGNAAQERLNELRLELDTARVAAEGRLQELQLELETVRAAKPVVRASGATQENNKVLLAQLEEERRANAALRETVASLVVRKSASPARKR